MNQTVSEPQPTDEALRLLIIDDDEAHAEVVAESLDRVGYECVIATSGSAGAEKIESEEFDVVLTDLRMPDCDGLAILRKAKQEQPEMEVVVITGHGEVHTAVQAMRAGAANYLQKPIDLDDLRTMVDKAADRLRLVRANKELRRQLDERFGFEGVIGSSPRMNEVLRKLKAVAPTSATVLIQGETGTGKELVAKAIHFNSPRKNKNFVPLNCTAINENLLEDELFGHEAGAFTGADKLRKGRFEHANGGTLFLDEVGDMPLSLQAKLLRVLENQEVYRIGSNEPIKVNVRLLFATNRDLDAAVANGEFRQDLYYRLKVVKITLPPLRERRLDTFRSESSDSDSEIAMPPLRKRVSDVDLLAAHFIKQFNQEHGKNVTSIAHPVRRAMAVYDWPGNVRELRNMIESMVVQDHDGVLGLDDLQDVEGFDQLQLNKSTAETPANLVGRPLHEVERYYVDQALQLTAGNREEAAKMLGIGERTLYRMITDWKLRDQVRDLLLQTNGDLTETAKAAGIKLPELQRKLKKWGMDGNTQ